MLFVSHPGENQNCLFKGYIRIISMGKYKTWILILLMFILVSFRNSLLNHVSFYGHWVCTLISTWHASLCMCLETKFGCDLCALPYLCIDREFVCENTWDPLITTSNQIYPSIKQCSSIKSKCIHTHTHTQV